MTTKIPRRQRGPRATFRMLNIPCGTAIEFLHDNVFLAGPGEKFTVADQELAVTCEYEGEDYVTWRLGFLTRVLERTRDPKAKTNLWPLRFWTLCGTQTKLSDIYHKKK